MPVRDEGVARIGSRSVNAPLNQKAMVERDNRRDVAAGCFVGRPDGSFIPVALKNLSYDGCCIVTDEPFAVGDTVSLSVNNRGQIEAEIRWVRGGEVGLRFVAAEPEQPKIERKQSRRPLRIEVQLRKVGHPAYHVDVRDLSESGCKVTLVDRPRDGDRMLIKFAGLDAIDCHVRWVEGYSAGLQFDRPIHPAVFDLLMARLAGNA